MGPSSDNEAKLQKMVANQILSMPCTGCRKVFVFAQKAGLDVATLKSTTLKQDGAAFLGKFRESRETMSKNEFDFAFAIEWMHKT